MKDIGKKRGYKYNVVLHVLEPEPEGTIGGADMHVLELAKFQTLNTQFRPIVFINQNHAFEELLRQNCVEYIFFDRKKGFFKHVFAFVKWLSVNNISILHGHGYDANYIIFFAKVFSQSAKHIPVVMTCHGWMKNNFVNTLKTYLDYIAISVADSLIYVSENIINSRLNKGKQFRYIPNSVFERKVEKHIDIHNYFKIEKKQDIIGYIGRLSPEKRIDILLRACAKVIKSHTNICFVIVGNGPEVKKLHALAKQLNIADKVIFTGLIIDSNLVANIYMQINFLVQTSDTETTSRVVLEAMSVKKAVIATNVGGMEQVIQHKKSGFLVKRRDYQAIAKYCIQLIDNPELAKELGKNAYQIYTEKFTMKKEAISTEEVYNNTLLLYK